MAWSNARVAVATCGAAGVLGSAWAYWGWEVHKLRMDHANAYERRLADRLQWKNKADLTAFQPCSLTERSLALSERGTRDL